MYVLAAFFILLRIVTAESRWDHVVASAVDEPLRRRISDDKFHGIGCAVMQRHFAGRASQKLGHGVVAEMQLPGLLQIQNAGQRNYLLYRGILRRQAKRKLSAGGVAHHDDFV